MLISIVIVNFNTKKLIKNCIESIFKAKPKVNYEIIIIDNGSNDGSCEFLKNISAKYPKTISLYLNKQNLGYASANNQGIKKSKGKYILLLNSDTLVLKDSLENLYEFAQKTNSRIGIIGGQLLNPDGSIQESVFNLPTLGRAIRQYWFGEKEILDKYAPKDEVPREVEAVVGAAFLITPYARKKVGLLNERYFMYFEDLDYCRRVKRASLKVYYLPSAKFIHYHGASGEKAGRKLQNRRLIESSKIYHGLMKYYLLTSVVWLGQKWRKIWSFS